ncbi:biopolymer transporter ExbD [Hoeflea sp. YIM 152468]|uniref:ExbD/TolR family protein n=1 Tax=Hoeflea sp. YIM 152468 TaxID=3031759 RepID=UPI0023DAC60D|nr:biopolymer transporter ExbD [Hoeflea sp. YIM 152468]MDF1609091.1 biopolymer transporter ExbD [Hoeflea sp. YIM 152468]
MRFEASSRHRRRISMTSLIDVIFLLLLFFMLSSTFSRFADVELGTRGGTGAAAADLVPAFIKLSEGRTSLNGAPLPVDDLARELAHQQSVNRINVLIVSVDATANSQQLVDILLIARKLPGLGLQIVQ